MSRTEAPYPWVETEKTVTATSRDADLHFGDAVVVDDDEVGDGGVDQRVQSIDDSVQYGVRSLEVTPRSSCSDLGPWALGSVGGQGSVTDMRSSSCDGSNPDLANAVLWYRPGESDSDDAEDEPAGEPREETGRPPRSQSLERALPRT